jgi:ABC-type multidrug transport system fused ATPase/permease subunit
MLISLLRRYVPKYRTEVLTQKAMTQLRRTRTSFVIAHRLSTIRSADTFVVMDQGRIVEQGSYRQFAENVGTEAVAV